MTDVWAIEFKLFGVDQDHAEELTDVVASMLDCARVGYTGHTYPLPADTAE